MSLDKIKKYTISIYKNSFFRYVFVGASTVLIDISLLVFCHEVLGLRLEIATTLSYWTSITYNFSLNRLWSFGASEHRDLKKHAGLYIVLLGFNYLFTLLFVAVGSQYIHYGYAKILAIGISISWTYLIYNKIIFKKHTKETL